MTNRNQHAIEVIRHISYIFVPTWIDLDRKHGATVKAELAGGSTEHTERKMFAPNHTASETARRLAISGSVFESKGSEIQFWARRKGAKVVKNCP